MCPTVKPFLEFSLEEWEETMDNNAKSTFLMCRLVLPGMPVRGKGAPSFPSMTGVRAATHLESLHCVSKAAMHQFARALAVEYRDQANPQTPPDGSCDMGVRSAPGRRSRGDRIPLAG